MATTPAGIPGPTRKLLGRTELLSVALWAGVTACDADRGVEVGPPGETSPFVAPIVGTPMEDVFYGAYFDHARAGSPTDYECRGKVYAGHRGVDILLRNFREQDAGVAVLAAAGGVVERVVDGLPDRNTSWDVGGGFGNHVVIRHPDGLRSVYAHLRTGSIQVGPGEEVEARHPLGLVGSSGRSNWPHLHFEIQGQGRAIDPFTGPCGPDRGLWDAQLPYQDEFVAVDAGLLASLAAPGLDVLLERPPTATGFTLASAGFRFWIQVANQPAGVVRVTVGRASGPPLHVAQTQVPLAFSMRFVSVPVPVAGVLDGVGEWMVRVYHGDELIHVEPFHVGAITDADVPVPSEKTAGVDAGGFVVLDQRPSAG